MNINTTAYRQTLLLSATVADSLPAASALSGLRPSAPARHQVRVSVAAPANARCGMSASWPASIDSLAIDAMAAFAGTYSYAKQGLRPRGVPR